MKKWDIFISHASEDKNEIATPLYNRLKKLGLKVWYDEIEIKHSDDIPTKIDNGFRNSKYFVIIYSPNYLKKDKKWTLLEEKISAYSLTNKNKVVIPIYHNISEQLEDELLSFIRINLAFDTKKEDVTSIALDIAKNAFEFNLSKIIEKYITLDEIRDIALKKIPLTNIIRDEIKTHKTIKDVLESLYRLDCDFIPILKEIQTQKDIEHSNIENYILLLEKLYMNCIEKKIDRTITSSSKVIGIVVDISLPTDKNRDLYTVEIGAKYSDNRFVAKYVQSNIKITPTNTENLKTVVTELLNELILDKESNFASKTLIEFIVPIALLEIDFKDLTIISKRTRQERSLIEYYNYIVRLKERIDYHHIDKDTNWIRNWKLFEADKDKYFEHTSMQLDKMDIGIELADNYSCVIQNFKLQESIMDIIEYGISIVISPLQNNDFSQFYKVIEEGFNQKKLNCISDEINNFIRCNLKKEECKSHLLLLWDNPNDIPNKEYRTKLIKGVDSE